MPEVDRNSLFSSSADVPLRALADSPSRSAAPAAVIRLNAEQAANIRAAADRYELAGPAGQLVCVRRQTAVTPSASIAFTPEQWEKASCAPGTVEIQDHSGATVGYLVLNPHINLFYTTQAIDSLVERAREARPGRTLGEILGEALARAGA